MVHYKLVYFNLRGRAELARLIFSYAQVPFEDFRIDRWGTEWPQMKPTMPIGQVPILEVHGKVLAQSYTIGRYLAREFGLAGKDDWEQVQADMYADCVNDLHRETRTVTWEADPVKQKEMFDQLSRQTLKPHVERIEEHLVKNGTGFLVGNALTWADIAYYAYLTTPLMGKYGGDVLTNAPNLKSLVERVGQFPTIKKYVDSRPVTPF